MSIKKVASIAGVSIATVSRYFSNPEKVSKTTTEKVQRAIKEANYWPNALAQNLRRGKTSNIILIIPHFGSTFYAPMINKLNQLSTNNNYHLLIQEQGFNNITLSKIENIIRSKQADGVIVLTGLADENEIHNSKLPIVLAGEPMGTEKTTLPYLSINYYQASQEATKHLIDLGHKTLGFISKDIESNKNIELLNGFLSIAKKSGSTPCFIKPEHSTLNLDEKLDLMLNLQPQPTAIYCNDDETAFELLHLLKGKGFRIPEDISVMGFHNLYFSKLCDPPLTTINNPMIDIGEQAMKILLDLLAIKSTEDNASSPLTHALVLRKSTAPPKK